jgi:aspartokinase
VTGQKNLVRMRGRGTGATSALLSLAHGERLPMQALVAHLDQAELLLALDDVPDWSAVRERARALIPDLVIDEGLGAVTVVGDFIGRDAGAVERARLAAAEAGLAIEGILTSPLRVTLLCAVAAVDGLVQVLHQVLREAP